MSDDNKGVGGPAANLTTSEKWGDPPIWSPWNFLGWCRVGVSTMTHGSAPCTGMVDEALKRPPIKPADSLFDGARCSAA